MTDYITFNQVLMFKEPETSLEMGEALWSAVKEVEAFYNGRGKQAEFLFTYLSEDVPEAVSSRDDGFLSIGRFWDLLFKKKVPKKGILEEADWFPEFEHETSWQKARGKYLRTFNAYKIEQLVRGLLGDERMNDIPIIVIDQELTPPPNWRYIIWRAPRKGFVVSTVPTDPEYWRIQEPNRIAVIKHRIRTAIMHIVGHKLGLRYCSNERCFLFRPVDSVVRLDQMVELGPEHADETGHGSQMNELIGYGYVPIEENPYTQQMVIQHPESLLKE